MLGFCALEHAVISPSLENLETAEIARCISSHAFTSVVWWVSSYFITILFDITAFITTRSVRMSLLYAIIRLVLPSTFLYNLMRAIGALFAVVWVLLVGLKTWCIVLSTLGHPECLLLDFDSKFSSNR